MSLPTGKVIKGILCDITGVLYDFNALHAIPGSVEAMRRLKKSNMPFKLLTNQDKDRSDLLVKYLHDYGFDMIVQSDLICPVPAAVQYMKSNNLKSPFLLVHENVVREFDAFDCNSLTPDCVVLGDAGHAYTYQRLNTAFRHLTNMHKPVLISIGSARYYKFKRELLLDVAPFVKALEHATDIKAVTIGKPSPEFFRIGLDALNVKPEEAVMIGDDLETDIKAAERLGIRGIAVQTGKGKNTTIDTCDTIVPDFAAAIHLILTHNEQISEQADTCS